MPPWCKIQNYYFYVQGMGATPAPSLVLIKWRGSKDIEWTTHWARKSGLTLTFEHVTWKSIEIIYSLRVTPSPSEGVKRYWADNTWSTDRQTDWPTFAKQYAPFFKRGIKISLLWFIMNYSHPLPLKPLFVHIHLPSELIRPLIETPLHNQSWVLIEDCH